MPFKTISQGITDKCSKVSNKITQGSITRQTLKLQNDPWTIQINSIIEIITYFIANPFCQQLINLQTAQYVCL